MLRLPLRHLVYLLVVLSLIAGGLPSSSVAAHLFDSTLAAPSPALTPPPSETPPLLATVPVTPTLTVPVTATLTVFVTPTLTVSVTPSLTVAITATVPPGRTPSTTPPPPTSPIPPLATPPATALPTVSATPSATPRPPSPTPAPSRAPTIAPLPGSGPFQSPLASPTTEAPLGMALTPEAEPLPGPSGVTGAAAAMAEGAGRVTQQQLGTVLGAAPDLWTGNSTFSFPIELSPGPAGFVPSLALVYSSEVPASQLLYAGPETHAIQAGHEGYGWSLTVPLISSYRDDSGGVHYTLSLNGASYELVRKAGNEWATRPETFMRIYHDSAKKAYQTGNSGVTCGVTIPVFYTSDALPWYVWTPDGTRYQFGDYRPNPDGSWPAIDPGQHRAAYYRTGGTTCDGGWLQVANRWGLYEATDTNGNGWVLTWEGQLMEPASIYYGDTCGTNPGFRLPVSSGGMVPDATYVRAFYPTTIAYGNVVVYLDPVQQRDDVPPDSDHVTCETQKLYTRERLAGIRVTRNDYVLRHYVLNYNDPKPSYLNHMQLQSIDVYGINSANAGSSTPKLPSYSFAYELKDGRNGVFLKTVSNGYGGSVTFDYVERQAPGATGCKNSNLRWAVAKRTLADGVGPAVTTTYEAGGGLSAGTCDGSYEFFGFTPVTEKLFPRGLAAGTPLRQTVSSFHQRDDAACPGGVCKGKLYRQEIGDGVATIQTNTWNWSATAGGGPQLNSQAETVGGVTRTTAFEAYDAYGNPHAVKESGPTGLYRWTQTDYVFRDIRTNPLTDRYIVDRPGKTTSQTAANSCVSQTEYDYGAGYAQPPTAAANLLGVRSPVATCSDTRYHETRYTYACQGNKTGETVTGGAATTYGYDAACTDLTSVTQVKAGGNLVTTYSFDTYGRPATTTLPDGQALKQTYDDFGRLCSVSSRDRGASAFVQRQAYAYSDRWNLAGGCPALAVAQPGGAPFAIAEQLSGDTPGGADPVAGGLTSYRYFDGLGRPMTEQTEQASTTSPWVTTHRTYDALGQLAAAWLPYARTSVSGALGAASLPRTLTSADPLGRSLEEASPDGSTTSRSYASSARAAIVVDGRGHRRTLIHDAFGRLTSVKEHTAAPAVFEAEGTSSSHGVGSATGSGWTSGPANTACAAAPCVLTSAADAAPVVRAAGQAVRFRLAIDDVTSAEAVVARIDVLDGSRVLASRDLRRSEFLGSGLFRDFGLVFDTGSGTATLHYEVWWFGNVVLSHDKTLVAWDTGAQTTRYEYDVQDALTDVYDAANNRTRMRYDAVGQKIALHDPDTSLPWLDTTQPEPPGYWWTYEYSPAGNLVRQTDTSDQSTCFYYDGLNRLVGKYYQGGASCPATTPATLHVRYTYDDTANGNNGIGRRTAASVYDVASSALSNAVSWFYDARGRLARETRTDSASPASYATDYGYDNLDRLRTTTYPPDETGQREVLTTAYDARGLPLSLTSSQGGQTLAGSAAYDAGGRLTALQLPAGALWRQQQYYPWTQYNGRLKTIAVGSSLGGTGTLNLSYTGYDPNGNLTALTDGGTAYSFDYDALDRLTRAYDTVANYAYDALGRLTSFEHHSYAPDSVHPHAITRADGTARYSYDNEGNMVRRSTGLAGEQQLGWDSESRLATTYQKPTATTTPTTSQATAAMIHRYRLPLAASYYPQESYAYDGDGQRAKKAVRNGSTRSDTPTLYIGAHLEVTLAAGQAASYTKYYWFGGQPIAMRRGTTLTYLHADHLGSVSVATDASGATLGNNRPRYYAYGRERVASVAGLPTDYTFTGQKRDGSGLLYFRARYYDPALGIFVQPDSIVPDPANPQALNRYAYCGNNPLNCIDPTGHAGVPLWQQVVSFGGGLAHQYVADMTAPAQYLLEKAAENSVLAEAALNLTADLAEVVAVGDCSSDAYQAGQFTGRVASTAVAIGATVEGGAMLLGGITGVGGSALVDLAASSVGPGGTVASVAATAPIAGVSTGAVVVGGAMVVTGAGVLVNNYNNPIVYYKGSGGGGGGKPWVTQTGGHTINADTAKALGVERRVAGRALEALKKELRLPNNFHSTKIWSDGKVYNSDTGEYLGDLNQYLP